MVAGSDKAQIAREVTVRDVVDNTLLVSALHGERSATSATKKDILAHSVNQENREIVVPVIVTREVDCHSMKWNKKATQLTLIWIK